MTNRAYAKSNGDGLLCSIMWCSADVVVIMMVNMMVMKVMVSQPTEYNIYLNPWYDL